MTDIPLNPFILVDGSAYLFRAYHALPPLTNKSGVPTGATFGVINMLRNLIGSYSTNNFAVIFDTPGKNFRHELFPEYKANRGEMPEELAQQIPYIIEIIEAMGIPVIRVPGVEADDVIGTLARKACESGVFTLISSGDKDFAQLVNDKIILVNTMTNTFLDCDGVIEKFQVTPGRIIDYLALIGDSVDNIPGVPKVGPKTAVKWLNEYKNLDGIINNAEKIKGKVGENLRSSLEDLSLYKELVTILTDVELEVEPNDIVISEPDNKKLKETFDFLEFKKWAAELGETTTTQEGANFTHETIFSAEQLSELLLKIKESAVFAFDTETTSLNAMEAELVGVAVSVAGQSYYIPVAHEYPGVEEQLSLEIVKSFLSKVMSYHDKVVVAHNIKYDACVLANLGIEISAKIFDTMLASYVYNSVAGRHDLSSVSERYLGLKVSSYEDVAGKGAKQKTFQEVEIEKASAYSAEDAWAALLLYEHFSDAFKVLPKLKSVFHEIEMPLSTVLLEMERYGVLIDSESLALQSLDLQKSLKDLEEKAFSIAGEEFNFNSPKQLQVILFDKLGLPVLHKTPKGQASTAEPVLQELAKDFELPEVILRCRSLSKLKSTYTDSLPQKVLPKTGRVHTSYHQAVTSTGRLSSTDPNLQNIPIKTQEGRRVREAFIAPGDKVILSADYSQIELRIMAHLSEDKQLVDAFMHGVDVHKATASEVFSTDISEVTSEMRRHAKAINFGLIYGMSAYGLSQQLSISKAEAEDYISSYFAKFPGVKLYMERTRDFAHKHGYVETLFGRRLYLPEIGSKNAIRRKAAERAAINAPMQGGQADIIKIAMINIAQELRGEEDKAQLIMQVHDELIFEVTHDYLDEIAARVKKAMSEAAQLKVELLVDVGWGQNWEQAH